MVPNETPPHPAILGAVRAADRRGDRAVDVLGEDSMTYLNGAKDGRHYWLTPLAMWDGLNDEFQFTFDPCPFPRPEGFDGLNCEWGTSNYVNPPFGGVENEHGKVVGPTAWAKKAIVEYRKGKRVILVYPIDKWVHMLLEAGATVRNLKDVRWLATEDGEPGKGTGRWVAMFILDPQEQDNDNGAGI